ncbi:hypothetical protein [Candidatus Nitrotoga sp. 1052]|uniref:hypothetical protein n=1 Tax=Candidatus Nitrotoga sp. 1052 TaxID=2886964 RepID=UPI001EF45C97|nr:hypothetical protein [Candidatus Nitrotoga sp. 1052]
MASLLPAATIAFPAHQSNCRAGSDFVFSLKQFSTFAISICFKVALLLLNHKLLSQGYSAFAFGPRFFDLAVELFDFPLKPHFQVINP